MKRLFDGLLRIVAFGFFLIFWSRLMGARLEPILDFSAIVGGIVLTVPIVWIARKMLDRQPTLDRTVRITTVVHYSVVFLFGTAIFRAIATYREWSVWTLPIPQEIGLALAVVCGAAAIATVVNLALKGLGAPFAVALSRKLTTDWMYAWTRNPMVLATLAFFLSLGIWFRSALFLLWVLFLVSPVLLLFVKMYEERELEIRFGASYLEYKSKTPILFPRRPQA